jgi:hypothetical protein
LPKTYKYLPPAWVDMIALHSDWAIYGMDANYVFQCKLYYSDDPKQEALFDPSSLES